MRRHATVGRRAGSHHMGKMRLADRLALILFCVTIGSFLALMIYTHTPWAR